MSQTILFGDHETEVPGAAREGEALWIPLDDLERATGWERKPQGLCQGEVCVPVPRGAAWVDEKRRALDVAAFARHLRQPVVRDDAHSVWSFGPAAGAGAASGSGPVMAPDFTLPDLDGRMHSLAEQRGKKVLLYCWASW